MGGLLASYLINKDMIKKKEDQATIKPSEYVGSVGEKITFEATLKKQQVINLNMDMLLYINLKMIIITDIYGFQVVI